MAYVGQIIGGKYRICALIDEGGMSKVYLALDSGLKKEWAVKEIPVSPEEKDDSPVMDAAMREVNIIKDLEHRSIVRIVDIFRYPEAVYIVEDLIRGRSLGELIRSGYRFRETEIISWAAEICSVLDYLHSRNPKIIYRDIKPDNIILTGTGHIMLVDFGIARFYKPEQKRDTQYLGTVQFAAPEQYEEFGAQTDERTDIYGLGCTLMYLGNACDGLSGDLKKIIGKCVRTMPQDRYQNAREVSADLKKLSSGMPEVLPVIAMLIIIAALAVSSFLLKGAEAGTGAPPDSLLNELDEDTPQKRFSELKNAVADGSVSCRLAVEVLRSDIDMYRKGGIEAREINELIDEIYNEILSMETVTSEEGEKKKELLEMTEKLFVTARQIYEEEDG